MNTFHITNRLLKSTLFCGLLLFSSSALSCSSDDDGGGNGGTQLEWLEPIRVASYNIQYDNSSDQDNKWTTRRDLLRQLLQSEKFDIFGAQEPYLTQIKDIEPFLDGYTWVGENVIGDKTAQRRHYNPVFYRKDKFEVLDMGSFWYSETPSAPGSKGWDSYSPRMCNWVHFRIRANGREFYHFNSHFDHIGTTARAESAKLLVAKVREIAGGKPAFCTGDFNSNQNTEAYKTIAGSGILADSYVRCPSKTNGDWPTYNGYKYISTPPAAASRIDHVFVTPKDTKGTCVYCKHCHPCPAGLDIGLINKYYDLSRLGDVLAKEHYLTLEKAASDCLQCGHCNSRCPFSVDQMARMEEIQAYFGK